MKEVCTEYVEYLKMKKKISKNTEVSYQQDLDKMVKFFQKYGIERFTYINEVNLESYIMHLELAGKSPATINRTIAVLKGFFDYLFKKHVIAECITDNLKRTAITKTVKEAPDESSVHAIIEEASGEGKKAKRDWLILMLLCETGLQLTEVIQLKQSDINYELGIIQCYKENSSRAYRISPEFVYKLRQYIEIERKNIPKSEEKDILFLNKSGDPISRQGVWKMIKMYAKKAGVEEVTPSKLRRISSK